jgi:hypothetical protein
MLTSNFLSQRFRVIFQNSAPDRMGPVVTISIGAILNTGGYFALWAAAVGKFDPPYWVLLIVCLVACNGQTWLETAALVTCVQNFETER